jgi:CheY-like chemotaxis protein
VLGNATPETDSQNNIIGYVGTITDITNLKLFEIEQIKLREKAEESNRLKSAFLANVSHEIRTPMNGILGFADLLADDDITDEERKDYLDIINQSGRRMLNIINDIISLSRIEAGLIEVQNEYLNINEILGFLEAFFKPEAEAKKLRLTLLCALPDEETYVYSDKEKLISVYTNLLKNALKYTDSGFIEFGYTTENNSLVFYVKDSGIGIKPDRQQAVFERFVQADIEDRMAKEGAGLGLTISKAYIEILGGKLWLESIDGEGSTFYFTISGLNIINKSQSFHINKQSSSDEVNLEKLNILVAEDDKISERHITSLLKSWKCNVINAQNGLDAVELFKQHSEIDIILMDIKMPIMDGLSATREIRKLNDKITIIAVTAYALSSDVENAISAGCNEHLSKPVVRKELMEKLRKYLV